MGDCGRMHSVTLRCVSANVVRCQYTAHTLSINNYVKRVSEERTYARVNGTWEIVVACKVLS